MDLKKEAKDKSADSIFEQKQLVSFESYQPEQGTFETRKAASDLINYYYPGIKATPEQCCITNGATQALLLVIQVI